MDIGSGFLVLFKKFGDPLKPVIVLLHGGGLSWWSYKNIIELLKNSFYIITPVLDGFGEDFKNTFVSIEDSAQKIIKFIKDNFNGSVYAICGLSIGAQILVEILSLENDITKKACIESALVIPMKFTKAMTIPMYTVSYGLVKLRSFAKFQAKYLFIPSDMLEEYYNDSSKVSKESLINMSLSNASYSIKKDLKDTNAHVLIMCGEKELKVIKKSCEILHKTIQGSKLIVIPKMKHGEISLRYPDKYVGIIITFFNELKDGVLWSYKG